VYYSLCFWWENWFSVVFLGLYELKLTDPSAIMVKVI
jgi:hypothetical protein